jgi:DNA topoisomerase VI subunit B
MKTEFIDITPDRSLMLKLGNSGYSLDESVAEFVDNSIDAMLEKRNLRVDVEINKGRILVKDNGRGMSREEIGNALKLGASKKENQLGKFGLGMKTACLSLGKCFDIKSSEGKGFVFMAGYNQEKWLNEGRWNSFPLVVE